MPTLRSVLDGMEKEKNSIAESSFSCTIYMKLLVPTSLTGLAHCPPPTPLQSLDVRAKTASDREDWIAAIMEPLVELSKVPGAK